MTSSQFDLGLTSKTLNLFLLWFFERFGFQNHASDESQFSDKAPLEHPITIYTTNGTPMPISHKGTISSPL